MLGHILVALTPDATATMHRLCYRLRSAPTINFRHVGGLVVGGFAAGTAIAHESVPVPSGKDCRERNTDKPEFVIAAAFDLPLGLNLYSPHVLLCKLSFQPLLC